MLSFLYESTVFLGCSYGFYYFILRRSRSFVFTRYYFLIALLLSLIVPFLKFEIGSSLPLVSRVAEVGFYTLLPLNGDGIQADTQAVFSLNSLLYPAYLMGLSLLLLRFLVNLFRLARKAKKGMLLKGKHSQIILTEENGLPFSFFRNIYINRQIYEKGEEVDKILLHECAHCQQFHSADILFAECVKVILWFNPFAWFMVKAIRLNHEYMADEKVLESQCKNAYQLLLINMELANQSICLASDFNYSLTKKRLAMMNNKNIKKNSSLIKIASIPLFLILVFMLTFCEAEQKIEVDPYQSMEFIANDWWRPILEKHDITPRAYNNFEFIFEMGSTNSIDEHNVVTLSDAFFLIRKNESTYSILRSPLATHNLETGLITGAEGILESYNLYHEDPEILGRMELINFKYQLVQNKHNVSADYIGLYEQGKEVMRGWTGSLEAWDSLVIAWDGVRLEEQ